MFTCRTQSYSVGSQQYNKVISAADCRAFLHQTEKEGYQGFCKHKNMFVLIRHWRKKASS